MKINKSSYSVISAADAENYEPEPTSFIIDTLIPNGFKTVLAGTTGSNKSYFAMQEGMSIANGEKEFLGFKILQPGLKVLYVDTEVGKEELIKRFHRIKNNFEEWVGSGNFLMMSKNGVSNDFWTQLKKQVILFQPDIIYIDCMYNAATNKDLTKNVNIFKFTDLITGLHDEFNVTTRIIHHFNKGGHEFGLSMDRMSGASALQNWAEHLTLITYTNVPSLRLFKIVKSRGTDFPRQYFGIEWNVENYMLEMLGIVMNWMKYLVSVNKTEKWSTALDYMSTCFTTKQWIEIVSNRLKTVKERQAKQWLKEMESCGVIKKISQGRWNKTSLTVVDELIQAE